MKKLEDIDEWFFNRINDKGKFPFPYNILAYIWFKPTNFIREWHYRIFVRGVCAIRGCNVHESCGGYLPDDVCEWYCERCWAEGMDHVFYTQELFYPDDKLHNFIEALRGY